MSEGESELNNGKQVLDSLDSSCNELKHAYDACFNSWFTSSFLKNRHNTGPTPCDGLLKIYSDCVKKALKDKKIELELVSETSESETPSASL